MATNEGRVQLLLQAFADYNVPAVPSERSRADWVMLGAASEVEKTEEQLRSLAQMLNGILYDAIDSLSTDQGVAAIAELTSKPMEFDKLLAIRQTQIDALSTLGRLVEALRNPGGDEPAV